MKNKVKKPKKIKDVTVFNWPITRERYKQILIKMHRQYDRITALKVMISNYQYIYNTSPEEIDMNLNKILKHFKRKYK